MLEVVVFKYLPGAGIAEMSEAAIIRRRAFDSLLLTGLYLYECADTIVRPVEGNPELIAELPHGLYDIGHSHISAYLAPSKWEATTIIRVGSTIVASANRYLTEMEGSPLMPYMPRFYLPKHPPLTA